ncbi:MAG: tRNA pseudouridine(13) synthase TruD [Nanoarchaeota archaeon]
MYIIKQIPEDFVVKEISSVEIKDKGRHAYFRLKKKNRNTLDVIKEIARQLHLKEKQIGFAGNKDKQAVTEQLISIPVAKKEKIKEINVDNVSLDFVGYDDRPLSLGDLQGNEFEVVARNLDKCNINKIKFVENYFDEQRFGSNNVEIGKGLVRRDFSAAAQLINNSKIKEHLAKNRNDFVGALKELPMRLLKMYVHAYQSYLWNETLAHYLSNALSNAPGNTGSVVKEVRYFLGKFVFVSDADIVSDADKFSALEIPLIGFAGGDYELDDKLKGIITKIMSREEISFSDFVIRQIPELSLEGGLRKAFVEIGNLKVGKEEKDDFNKRKKKIKLAFSLPKGSYATIVIKRICS